MYKRQLLLGVGRFVLGPRRCAPPHGGLHPAGKGWKGHRHPWGPWGWHAHGEEWQEGDDPDADEDLAYDEAE